MAAPMPYPKNRKDLLEDIRRRAPFYTPEWRYNPDVPDAGTALAMIWADMHEQSIARYNRSFENFRRELLDTYGSGPMPSLPAHGYLSFTPTGSEAFVPKGTGVSSPDSPSCVLETDRGLEISQAKLTAVYYVNPSEDICERHDSFENINLFSYNGKNNRSWTFPHPFAFDSPDLRLQIECDGAVEALCGEAAVWQFLEGEQWRGFDCAEVEGGYIRLRFPGDKADICGAIRLVMREATPFRGISVCAVRALPSGTGLKPAALYSGDTQQADDGFYPFGQRFMPYNCFYLSCAQALSKPCAEVELNFTMRMDKIPIEGYPLPEIRRRRVMRAEELLPPEQYEVKIADTAWEYYNGRGWASLELLSAGSRGIFGSAGQAALRYTVKFICPGDIQPFLCGAHDAPFIRARIISADNLFRTNGYYLAPWIESVRFNYRYHGGVYVKNITISENMKERTVRLEGPERLINPAMDCTALCFAFDRPFTSGSILFHLASEAYSPELRWEYYSDKGWEALDIYDETQNLSKTGLIAYQALKPPARLSMLGNRAYWIRAVMTDGGSAHIQLRLFGLWQNAVSATARNSGSASNLPAGSYRTLASPSAGIKEVFNPLPASGGCDVEDEEGMIVRLTAAFCHRGRAVSRADYEALARESSTDVLRCRCLPSPGGMDLVVLRRGGAGRSDDFEPLRARIHKYVSARRPIAAHGYLRVNEPRFVSISIVLWAGVEDVNSAHLIRGEIASAMNRFLCPETGGIGEGWEIGSLPSPAQLSAMLRGLSGLVYIQSLDVSYRRGASLIDYRTAMEDRFALPVSGAHEIHLRT